MKPKIYVFEKSIKGKIKHKGELEISPDIAKLIYISEVMKNMEFENLRDSDVNMCDNCYHRNKSPYDVIQDYIQEYFERLFETFYQEEFEVEWFSSEDKDKKYGYHAVVIIIN